MASLSHSSVIAVFNDAEGALAGPSTASEVLVYARNETGWNVTERHDFTLRDCSGLAQFRASMHSLAGKLDSCRILIGTQDNGASYSILDSRGFFICRMDGFDPAALERVRSHIMGMRQKSFAGTQSKTTVVLPKEELSGYFFLDINEEKSMDPRFTSKESLLTFFQTTPFTQLRIACDHSPRWLEAFVQLANLDMKKEATESGMLSISINHQPGHDDTELTGTTSFDSGGCACGT